MTQAATVIIGLGSSDADAAGWLRRAVAELKREPALELQAVSSLYESDALLPPGAPPQWQVPYLNLAVRCRPRPGLGPEELLERLKRLESKLGRRQRERWAPREIDLDLLAWEGESRETERLRLPHPGLGGRPFALLPLGELAQALLAELPAPCAERFAEWRQPGAQVPFRTRRRFEPLTELVTILNLTPDSFSDGGKLRSADAIADAAREALAQESLILDVGAESTRPGAEPIDPDTEWRRLEPAWEVLGELRRSTPGLRVSLDSRHPRTVERALEAGLIDWINDVGGFESARMRELALASRADLVVMHSLSVPARRELTLPPGSDPIQAILDWAARRLERLARDGIDPSRVILDPGIGFGKTPEQSLECLREARRLHALRARLLVGHSRKSFLGLLSQATAARERDLETAVLTAQLSRQGIEYLRVHDPASQRQALRLAGALGRGARLAPAGEAP